MVDFISEVQQELRKDDYNLWLKKYGPYVLGLTIAIVIAVAFWEWKKSADERLARTTSASYMTAAQKAEDGNLDGALSDFLALAEDAPAGYAGLSLMRASAIELDKGDYMEAVKLLDRASQTFELARHQQLAQMKAAYILAGQERYADVQARLAPLAQKGEPYEYLARELLGYADKESGNIAGAREKFAYLERIPGVPEPIRRRAEQSLSLMRVSNPVAKSESDISEMETASEDQTPQSEPVNGASETEDNSDGK